MSTRIDLASSANGVQVCPHAKSFLRSYQSIMTFMPAESAPTHRGKFSTMEV